MGANNLSFIESMKLRRNLTTFRLQDPETAKSTFLMSYRHGMSPKNIHRSSLSLPLSRISNSVLSTDIDELSRLKNLLRIYCNAPPNSALHQHPPASDREKGGSSEEHNGGTPLTSRRKNTGNVLVSPNRDHLDTRCDDLIALGKVAAMKSEPNPSSHVGGQLTSRSRSQTGAVTGGQQMMQMPLNGYLPKSSMNPTLSRMKSTMSKPQNGLSSFAAMSQSAAANNSSNSSAKNGVSNKGTISSRVSGGDYADPVSGAQNSFQLRLQEMVVLEGETIKYERQRKLGRRRLKFD